MATIASLYDSGIFPLIRRLHEEHEWFMRLHRGMELLREAARRLIPEFDSIEPHDARWDRLGAEVWKYTGRGRREFECFRWRKTVISLRTAADIKEADARAEAEKAERLLELIAAAEAKKVAGQRRAGRPRKEDSDKGALLLCALDTHHKREGNSVENDEPATLGDLAKLASSKHTKINKSTVSRFFAKKFPKPCYKSYVCACARREIGRKLAEWQGDLPDGRFAGLLLDESAPGDRQAHPSGKRKRKSVRREDD